MKKLTLLAALLTASFSAAAKETVYTIDSTHTYPSFTVNHLGFSIQRGTFDDTKGEIRLDLDGKKGSVKASIAVASVDTGLPKREEHLLKEEFFDIAKFPTIEFSSDTLVFEGDKLAQVDGQLTIKGVTKPISLKATHFQCGIHPMLKQKHCGAELVGNLKRSDFGVSAYVPMVGDEIAFSIQVEASNTPEGRKVK
ncbi:MAG: polyisoprenoid-binding protein [Gammaproteobacteria bacterium]|nr:polyisoprenoid-binding protein [Gammaproteobacteria bacterium]